MHFTLVWKNTSFYSQFLIFFSTYNFNNPSCAMHNLAVSEDAEI
jgi:hypothetical protein